MSRQYVDFKVVGSDTDTGEEDTTAIKPVSDGEKAQASVFVRPSENLRTRTEFLRLATDDSKYLHDADRAMLLTGTGSITWAGLPTGTFTSSANITLKPFLAPNASAASRLLICAGTQAQITFRTRQDGLSGQPRAYSGANTITFDFTPVTTGTGAIVVTSDGTPANNVHIQYDDHAVSGTTVDQINANSMVHQFNISAVAISLGLEAVVEGSGSPVEHGFPTPPLSVAASLIKDYISNPEKVTRYMAGAADAEKHIISPAQVTAFFADALNQLIEGDVIAVRYDDLVMGGDGGRRQSINENPENKAADAGLNLFLMRRFPERLPNSLPLAAVVDGVLIFCNNRSFASGEVGPIVSAGASYQGSPAAPNSWADGTTVTGPISFETALDTIIQTLGTKAGGAPGSIKVGFTPSGNIAANTVKGALEELDSEKAGLALLNVFTHLNTFNASTLNETAIIATGNGTGAGGEFEGGLNTSTGTNTNGVSPLPGPGTGAVGFGASGVGGGDGGQFFGKAAVGSTVSRGGVLGVGSYSQTTAIPGGAGGFLQGGGATVGDANGGTGAYGQGGNSFGNANGGMGVIGVGGTGSGSGVNGQGGYFSAPAGTSPVVHVDALNNWDLVNGKGDFQITDGSVSLKAGIATAGGGTGFGGLWCNVAISLGAGAQNGYIQQGVNSTTIKNGTATAPALIFDVSAGGPAIRTSALSAAPASPQVGDSYYDSVLKVWRVYLGANSGWSHTRYVVGDNGVAYGTGWSLGYAPGGSFRYDNLYYWLDDEGHLHFGGLAYQAAATVGSHTLVCTLPVGFRHTSGGGEFRNYQVTAWTIGGGGQTYFSGAGVTTLGISNAGAVTLYTGSLSATLNTNLFMDNVIYEALIS